jgi:hypothetical protein
MSGRADSALKWTRPPGIPAAGLIRDVAAPVCSSGLFTGAASPLSASVSRTGAGVRGGAVGTRPKCKF